MDVTNTELRTKVILPLQNATEELRVFREKYTNFQLQLITIAATTFSIYLAFGQARTTSLTKWGFVFLAVSLVSGLLSVISKFLHAQFHPFWQIFDAEKFIFNQQGPVHVKNLLAESGYTIPMAYNEKLDTDLLSGNEKFGASATRKISESFSLSFGGFFGALQLMAIVAATALLLIGLILTPVGIMKT